MSVFRKSGFTIIELLIVIVVIGILSTIVIISYRGVQIQAARTTLSGDLVAATGKLENYKAENSVFPDTIAAANLKLSEGVSVQYQYEPTTRGYCLAATIKDITRHVKNDATEPKDGSCPAAQPGGPVGPWAYTSVDSTSQFGCVSDCTATATARLSINHIPNSVDDGIQGGGDSYVQVELSCVEGYCNEITYTLQSDAPLQISSDGGSTWSTSLTWFSTPLTAGGFNSEETMTFKIKAVNSTQQGLRFIRFFSTSSPSIGATIYIGNSVRFSR